MSRTPDQLAREVRDHINDSPDVDSTMALAALAELQAQAEAGQRNAQALEDAWNEYGYCAAVSLSIDDRDAAWRKLGAILAAAAPSPADQEEA